MFVFLYMFYIWFPYSVIIIFSILLFFFYSFVLFCFVFFYLVHLIKSIIFSITHMWFEPIEVCATHTLSNCFIWFESMEVYFCLFGVIRFEIFY